MAEGIEVRHSRSCASREGRRCNCEPGYRVAAYDAISKRKVSKTFRTLGEARRWRAGAQTQAAKGVRLAGTSQTLLEAAEAFVDGLTSGAIRTRTGGRYKPSVVREYERSLRLHVFPTLGGARLSRIQRRDIQRLADELLASGADPSTIRNAIKPLQVIYRTRDRGRRSRRQPMRAAATSRCPWPPRAHRVASRSRSADRCASSRGPRAMGLRLLRRAAPRRTSSALVGRHRPCRWLDSRRAQHEWPRRDRPPEKPRRPSGRPDRRRASRPPRRAQARHAARHRPCLRLKRITAVHPDDSA